MGLGDVVALERRRVNNGHYPLYSLGEVRHRFNPQDMIMTLENGGEGGVWGHSLA